MKLKCPKCGTGKARRICPREGNLEICSECCASIRDSKCGDCLYFAPTQAYEKSRVVSSGLPDRHFLIEIDPEVEKSVNNALNQAQQGNTEKAMAILIGLLNDHPRNHDVTYGIGCVHAAKEEHEKSVFWFNKAISIYPYSIESYYNRGVAFQKLLDLPGCIRSYRKVVELGEFDDPIVTQARTFIASISASVWKTEHISLEAYLEAGDLFNQAFELMERGQWQPALDRFYASAAINTRNAPCYGNIGLCLAYLGRKAEALAALERALGIDPDYQPARTNREIFVKMEEGVPMTGVSLKTIDYAKDRLEEQRE